MPLNPFGQPVGDSLMDWEQPPHPTAIPLEGRTCRLEPLDPKQHADPLWDAFSEAPDGRDWTYLSWGPFPDRKAFDAWINEISGEFYAPFWAVVVDGNACGIGAYLAVSTSNGNIELGHLHFAPRLRQTIAATEALHLWLDHAFALGYRRVTWKCDTLNHSSRQAARRLGFSFEGSFRNHRRFKGRNRDTAWYAITDDEWPRLLEIHRAWLDPANFDNNGKPLSRLSERTAPLRHSEPTDN